MHTMTGCIIYKCYILHHLDIWQILRAMSSMPQWRIKALTFEPLKEMQWLKKTYKQNCFQLFSYDSELRLGRKIRTYCVQDQLWTWSQIDGKWSRFEPLDHARVVHCGASTSHNIEGLQVPDHTSWCHDSLNIHSSHFYITFIYFI